MKQVIVITALLLSALAAPAQAVDLGFQGGLTGSYALIADFRLDGQSWIRGFANSRPFSNAEASSVGAAYEYEFQPHIYGGLGAQVVNLTGSGTVTGFRTGVASYINVGYTDKLSDKMNWHGEINSFHGLVIGVTWKM